MFGFFDKFNGLKKVNNSLLPDDDLKIVIVLDESGSMQNMKQKMIDSINSLIMEQKQVTDKGGRSATFTLVKFNNNVYRVVKNMSLNNVKLLADSDYEPNGSTALYDAIGDTINWFENEKNVLMVIVTDGQENASQKYDKHYINKMINSKKESGWSYVYLSSDLNTFEQGKSMGLEKSIYTTNTIRPQHLFDNYISNELNHAVSNCRRDGGTVQERLNKN